MFMLDSYALALFRAVAEDPGEGDDSLTEEDWAAAREWARAGLAELHRMAETAMTARGMHAEPVLTFLDAVRQDDPEKLSG